MQNSCMTTACTRSITFFTCCSISGRNQGSNVLAADASRSGMRFGMSHPTVGFAVFGLAGMFLTG